MMMRERMMPKNWLWALVLSILVLPACVEPFELETGAEIKSLVVEGLITDQNRPDLNKVTLSWTAPFNGDVKTILTQPVYGAVVMVRDARNNSMRLTEGEYGVYTLSENEFKAEAGQSYTLHIRLPDGREYASRPELLVPVPPIQGIKYEFKEFVNVVENGSGALVEKSTVGFEVKVQTQDPEERGNFYRWDTEGVFEYFSVTEETDLDTGEPLPTLCWSNKGSINTKVTTSDDRLVNGRLLEHAIVVVPADIPTKYRVKVRQYSLTAEAYEFWRLFNEQQSSVGSIFDPPPAQIRGNLFSKTNPEEQVIGYFGASALAERYIVIPRYLHAPFPGLPYTVPIGDCRYLGLYPNVTDQRPEGF